MFGFIFEADRGEFWGVAEGDVLFVGLLFVNLFLDWVVDVLEGALLLLLVQGAAVHGSNVWVILIWICKFVILLKRMIID